jgi:small subunit ribosomal protein S6
VREYELTLILKPTLVDEALSSATERVQGWIASGGGETINVTPVGRKRLAYPVDHQRDGVYVLMQFRARPETIPEVERNLRLSEDVLRYMFIRR